MSWLLELSDAMKTTRLITAILAAQLILASAGMAMPRQQAQQQPGRRCDSAQATDERRATIGRAAECIALPAPIHFELAGFDIERRSHAMLQALAERIVADDDIELVRIDAHADGRGSADLQRKLSQKRAEAIVSFLVDHGVEPHRLQARGIAPPELATPRPPDRRVELVVTQRASDAHRQAA